MNFPPTVLVTLWHLFRRDGPAFFGKCARRATSLSTWLWLIRGGEMGVLRKIVGKSSWFDPEWMTRMYPEIRRKRMEPSVFYLRNGLGGRVHPGPDFASDEYVALHLDLLHSGMNPLVHWERIGQNDGSPLSFLDASASFPDGTAPLRKSLPRRPPRTRRTAVFAAFSPSGRIPERDLFFLKGLGEVSDNIVFVCSAPLFPDEAARLDGLVSEILCEPHGEYDFGSYKRGLRLAEECGLLDPAVADELILCNDSCYGPVFPLSESFSTMASRPCEFWGLTANREQGGEHPQSYFLVFRRPVLDSPVLRDFLDGVRELTGRNSVVVLYESRLTEVLREAGFSFDSFVPRDYCTRTRRGLSPSPVQWPVDIMSKHRRPLVKVKALGMETMENAEETLHFVRAVNPDVAEFMTIRKPLKSSKRLHGTAVGNRVALPRTFPAKERRIRGKVAGGVPAACILFASRKDASAAAALCEALAASAGRPFSPRVCIVPDMRDANPEPAMDEVAAELSARLGADRVLRPRKAPDGVWPDVLDEADIVFYPSVSRHFPFRYRPYWAIGRDFLPVLVRSGSDDADPGVESDVAFWRTCRIGEGSEEAASAISFASELSSALR